MKTDWFEAEFPGEVIARESLDEAVLTTEFTHEANSGTFSVRLTALPPNDFKTLRLQIWLNVFAEQLLDGFEEPMGVLSDDTTPIEGGFVRSLTARIDGESGVQVHARLFAAEQLKGRIVTATALVPAGAEWTERAKKFLESVRAKSSA